MGVLKLLKKNLHFNFLHKKQLKISKNRQYISDFYGLQYDTHLMTHSFHFRAMTSKISDCDSINCTL
jgi:hypothetical protein